MAPLLVLCGHPDDEFALFPWLEDAAKVRDVHLVYATDGVHRGVPAARREAESVRSLATLGIEAAQLHFLGRELGIGDGSLPLHLATFVDAVLSRFSTLERPTVWVPAWEGGHQDHDAVHLAGIAVGAALGAEVIEQYPLYRAVGSRGIWFVVLVPLAANGPGRPHTTSLKQRFASVFRCLHYRSQWRSFLGLLPLYALRMTSRSPFVLQPVGRARTATPPHPGAPLYERRGGPTWAEFAGWTADFREADAQ